MHLGGLAMGLTKYKLGKLIEQCDNRNTDEEYTADDVRGISTGKEFIETKANMDGVSLTSYKIVKENEFAYVADTSRRGDKIAVAFNRNEGNILISSIYTVFYVSKPELLLSDYLFMFFNRSEFDRYSRFNSWGSARETFSWEDMCDMEVDLPPLSIQQKYVDIYNAMLANQQSYERGLEDLKLVCDAYIDDLRKKLSHRKLGSYISMCENKNDDLVYGIDAVRGVSIEKKFIDTKANMEGVSLKPYEIVNPNEFAYVTVTSRNGEKISLARNNSNEVYICSSSYIVFKVNDTREDGLARMIPLIDFENWDKNIFRVVNQFTVEYTNNGQKENRRPDVLLFVNGIPLCVIELKNPADANATIYDAWEQINIRYWRDIPHLLHYCPLACISDGVKTRLGSVRTPYEHFYAWRRVNDGDTVSTLPFEETETMIKGVYAPERFLEIFRDYIYFQDSISIRWANGMGF